MVNYMMGTCTAHSIGCCIHSKFKNSFKFLNMSIDFIFNVLRKFSRFPRLCIPREYRIKIKCMLALKFLQHSLNSIMQHNMLITISYNYYCSSRLECPASTSSLLIRTYVFTPQFPIIP